uniref:Nuclease HARBI1 n=1 Tax=Brassica oleracea var. oleracea TaxID=109376 RepID=A0A0D3BRF8_BRAOL
MASSSHNIFDGSMDDAFDQYFDQQFDQYFDQAFENFSNNYGDQEKEKKKGNNELTSKEIVKKTIYEASCMHWEWKNCPTAWKGQYTWGSGKPTIVLEAVASYNLWIWHVFFGPPGTLNDFNVLDRSPVFDDIINGQAPQVTYSVNGREYHLAYYLPDGIYPKWTTFIQSIPLPQGPQAVLFAQRQEAVQKDVERAFGVLQARFAIIMRACIILHNMIVEDERDGYTQFDVSEFQEAGDNGSSNVDLTYSTDMPSNIDRQMHQQLKADLVEHIWRKFGRDKDNN